MLAGCIDKTSNCRSRSAGVFTRELKIKSIIIKSISTFSVLIWSLILSSIPASGLEAGEITGNVSIYTSSKAPQNPRSPFARYRAGESDAKILAGSDVIAVVYLTGHKNLPSLPIPVARPVMDQRNLTINPHILPIVVGTTVDFPNSDALYHNLFSLSPARKFDLGRYPRGVTKQVLFEKPGEVHVFCDIHPSMSSVILVLPNQFFSTVPRSGEYSLKGIPAGDYELHIWHEQLPEVIKNVTVPETGLVHLDVELGGN